VTENGPEVLTSLTGRSAPRVETDAKEDAIEVEGTVVEPLPNAMFRVELENGTRCSRTSAARCG
jgi:hypothetical protein